MLQQCVRSAKMDIPLAKPSPPDHNVRVIAAFPAQHPGTAFVRQPARTVLAGLAAAWFVVATAPAQAVDSMLVHAVDAHVRQPRFEHASWGVQIISLKDGRVLYETNAHKLHKPASNAKLFTGALVLDQFGPDFRMRTSVFAAGSPDRRGRLGGDLVIYGRGDPSFNARLRPEAGDDVLRPLVDAIAAAGVRSVSGDLVADESCFRGAPAGSSWTWEDLQHYYGAVASALSIHENTLDFQIQPGPKPGHPCVISTDQAHAPVSLLSLVITGDSQSRANVDIERPLGARYVHLTGHLPQGAKPVKAAVAVPDPALWFGQALKASLERRGIKVSGRVRVEDWRSRSTSGTSVTGMTELAHVDSPPLGMIVPAMMKPSQNLHAQLLLLQAGVAQGEPGMNTEAMGIRSLHQFLQACGIPSDEVRMDEGSGLSRAALVTPRAIVQLLRHMHTHRHAAAFLNALPVAGVDGTLAGRMKQTAAAGNVRAKTGTIRFVNCLSGYATSADGEPLAFSLMLNNYDPPPHAPGARADLDQIALWLVQHTRGSLQRSGGAP